MSDVHGVYGTQDPDLDSNLFQRLDIMGHQMLQCFDAASGFNVVEFGKKTKKRSYTVCCLATLSTQNS